MAKVNVSRVAIIGLVALVIGLLCAWSVSDRANSSNRINDIVRGASGE